MGSTNNRINLDMPTSVNTQIPPTQAPPNYPLAYSRALQESNLSSAYDYARQIENDEQRKQSTKAVTEIWIDQNQIVLLAKHITAHQWQSLQNDPYRHEKKDETTSERYAIAFESCNDQTQLDNLIIEILSIFASLNDPDDYRNFCDKPYSDYAGFVKACLDCDNQLFKRVLSDSSFPTTTEIDFSNTKVRVTTLFNYLLMKYDLSELNADALAQITAEKTYETILNRAVGNGDKFKFLENFRHSRDLEEGKRQLTTLYDSHGKDFFTQEFLNQIFLIDQSYLVHAYSLMNRTQMHDYA